MAEPNPLKLYRRDYVNHLVAQRNALAADLAAAQEALATLRAAWNYHMNGCAQFKALPIPDPDSSIAERVREWMNAPAATVSALPAREAARTPEDAPNG